MAGRQGATKTPNNTRTHSNNKNNNSSNNKDILVQIQECANPRIAAYLLDWYQEAEQRDSKLKFVYRKALNSVINLTTVINGREMRQLEKLRGIGPAIRTKIERRMQQDGTLTADTGHETIIEAKSSIEPMTQKRKASKKEYIPVFRSGPYAMLIALYLEQQRTDSKGFLLKSGIIELGQPYCTAAMDEGPFSPIQGAIKTLLSKELVSKTSIPARFSLTEAGFILAERLWNTAERRSSAPIPNPPTPKQIQEELSQRPLTATDSTIFPEFEIFSMLPGQFEIILLIDSREKKSNTSRTYFIERLTAGGINCEQRSLELGDFMWIARGKSGHDFPDEIVLDYLIERKIESDLLHSITDGRFQEQKFRLRACGLKNRIYLVEKCDDFDCDGSTRARFDAAVMQTQVADDLFLRYTTGMEETVRLLISLHQKIVKKMADCVINAGIMAHPAQRQPYMEFLNKQEELTGQRYYQSFGCFTQLNHKSANLTLRDIFMKQLLCIRQVNPDKAAAISERFPTLGALHRHYTTISEEKERENLFRDLIVDGSQRKFGPALSKRIYQVVYRFSYPESFSIE